jgi:hypothetical protein
MGKIGAFIFRGKANLPVSPSTMHEWRKTKKVGYGGNNIDILCYTFCCPEFPSPLSPTNEPHFKS